MTKPNTTGLSKQTSKKSNWPVWFPYPSSWLRAIILIAIAFPGTKLIIFGFIGTLISITGKSPLLFFFFLISGLLIPTVILSFIYHIFWFVWQDKSSENKWQKWIPKSRSLWEGFYATIIMGLSFSCILLIFVVLSFAYCQSNQYSDTDLARCSGKMTGRAANLIIGTIENKDFTDKPWFVIWMMISVYLYQAEYLLKQKLLPKVQSKFPKNSIQEKTAAVNPIDLELDNLRGSMGLTQMKTRKTSPPNSQSSHENQQEDNFEKAIKLAKNAAQITRTAKTKTEWYQVGKEWQKTIEMLKTVPTSHPKYAIAQEKIVDYQKYINYAQKIINSQHINN